jgi:hypothetical protein
MKLPNIDLKELEALKKDNFKERLDFISKYAEWQKKNQNKRWSSEQKEIVQ